MDTQLIIYPNETHGIQRPSYQRDRYERYLAWYDKYLKKGGNATRTAADRDPLTKAMRAQAEDGKRTREPYYRRN